MAPLYDFVLVAFMLVPVPYGSPQVEYHPVDYFNSRATCVKAQKKLSSTKDKNTEYACLKIDRD